MRNLQILVCNRKSRNNVCTSVEYTVILLLIYKQTVSSLISNKRDVMYISDNKYPSTCHQFTKNHTLPVLNTTLKSTVQLKEDDISELFFTDKHESNFRESSCPRQQFLCPKS